MKYSKAEIAVKSAVLFVWMVLICAAETTVLPRLKVFDSIPSLLPFVVAAVAVLDGPWAGLFCGVAAGFLADGVCGQSFCLYTVFYVNSIKDWHAKSVDFLLILGRRYEILKKMELICSFFNKNS